MKCGIIMPISDSSKYPENHWKDVFKILKETIEGTDFKPSLVSDDDAIGLIHERIVTNIYHNEIVICDVSSKNPNVMFELGLRLAFDKPTIIIKDEITEYSFDTGVIEHLIYPSTLKYDLIEVFKRELVKKINATYQRSIDDANYSPFLRYFGRKITPSIISETEINASDYLLDQLDRIKYEITAIRFGNTSLYYNWNDLYFDSNLITLNNKRNRRILESIISENRQIDFSKSNDENIEFLKNELAKRDVDIYKDELKIYIRDYINNI